MYGSTFRYLRYTCAHVCVHVRLCVHARACVCECPLAYKTTHSLIYTHIWIIIP